MATSTSSWVIPGLVSHYFCLQVMLNVYGGSDCLFDLSELSTPLQLLRTTQLALSITTTWRYLGISSWEICIEEVSSICTCALLENDQVLQTSTTVSCRRTSGRPEPDAESDAVQRAFALIAVITTFGVITSFAVIAMLTAAMDGQVGGHSTFGFPSAMSLIPLSQPNLHPEPSRLAISSSSRRFNSFSSNRNFHKLKDGHEHSC